jgi:hypothetical protein
VVGAAVARGALECLEKLLLITIEAYSKAKAELLRGRVYRSDDSAEEGPDLFGIQGLLETRGYGKKTALSRVLKRLVRYCLRRHCEEC